MFKKGWGNYSSTHGITATSRRSVCGADQEVGQGSEVQRRDWGDIPSQTLDDFRAISNLPRAWLKLNL